MLSENEEKAPADGKVGNIHMKDGNDANEQPAPELQLEVTEGEGDVGRLEWLFGGKDPEALRKAILLREVLGPPLALREEEEA